MIVLVALLAVTSIAAAAENVRFVVSDDKSTTTVVMDQGPQFALPYASDWTITPSEALIFLQSETLAMVASVSIDDWGEPAQEREYLTSQLETLREQWTLDDASVGGFGPHPVLSYWIALPKGYQLNLWTVRQRADMRIFRLHVSAVSKDRASSLVMRNRLIQLLATGYSVPR
jgi:hypothetical protein